MTSLVRDKPMLCLDCGYDLRACTRYVCPECGRGFSPDDPATFARPGHRFIRWTGRICWVATVMPLITIGTLALDRFGAPGLRGSIGETVLFILVIASLCSPLVSTGAALTAMHFYGVRAAHPVRELWLLSILAHFIAWAALGMLWW